MSNRSDERDNEVIAGVRKALAQPEPGDWGATLLDGWMESEGDAVRVVYEQVGDDRRLGFRFSVEDSLDAETTGTPADWDPLRFGCQVCREIRELPVAFLVLPSPCCSLWGLRGNYLLRAIQGIGC